MKGRKPNLRHEREMLGDRPAPNWFTEEARAEWNRVLPVLSERRVLTEADLGCLENYCMAIGTAREMERAIQERGYLLDVYKVDKDGNKVLVRCQRNPAVGVQADAMNRARLLAAELGATPVSRARPGVNDDEDDDLFGWGEDRLC
jgi:P27 family predicted phage terminase small subunit